MDYKEKQQMYKRINKERGTYVWMSREKGLIKGKTYVKKEQELKKMFEELDKESEEKKDGVQ